MHKDSGKEESAPSIYELSQAYDEEGQSLIDCYLGDPNDLAKLHKALIESDGDIFELLARMGQPADWKQSS